MRRPLCIKCRSPTRGDYGTYSDLNPVPTNHWEAVITLDGWTVAKDEAGGALATDMTTLKAAVAPTDTAIKIDPATLASFPDTQPFAIVVGSEIMMVTGGFGTDTWTVVRGADLTTATLYASGTMIHRLMPLAPGTYTIQALTPQAPTVSNPNGQTGLKDAAGNVLGHNGFQPNGVNYARTFTLFANSAPGGGAPLTGIETLVNDSDPGGKQATGTALGTGTAQEFTQKTVAVDHSGDFAVVWTSYGQDDPNDPNGAGVYVRMYDRNNNVMMQTSLTQSITAADLTIHVDQATAARFPTDGSFTIVVDDEHMLVTSGFGTTTWTVVRGTDNSTAAAHASNAVVVISDILVNTYTTGNQLDGTIAMDAAGDFVVVWASQGEDPDGSWGIYAQRFNSVGQKVGGEFRVNTNVVNDQVAPAVAMNSFGDFVIVWATKGQSFSYFNDIHGQIYDSDGNKVGGEFRVNSADIPGVNETPSSNELHPSVAMSDTGSFVVVWDAPTAEKNGVVIDSVIMARLFDPKGNPLAPGRQHEHDRVPGERRRSELHLRPGTRNARSCRRRCRLRRRARNGQVTMDSQGNFTVAWEAFQDDDIVNGGSAR